MTVLIDPLIILMHMNKIQVESPSYETLWNIA